MRRSVFLPFLLCAAFAAEGDEQFFREKVRPVLGTCQACHNQKNKASGLALDTAEAIRSGGNRGVLLEAGKPDASLLIAAVEHKGDLKMPPGGRLADDKVAVLREWISKGAYYPATAAKTKPGAEHWAFQPVRRAEPPAVQNAAWVRNPIDRFVLARLEKEGLKPSPEASRETLLRRVSLDLTGLPPTRKELDEFLADTRPDAYERVVKRLLASPHYGERQGRMWLDIARYADTDGYTIDAPRTMWRYRDWVLNALNSDMPFDRFVIEQFAGDLLPNATVDQIIATGFHRNTPSNFEGGIDFEQYRVEAVVDRVSTTGAAFLGLTLGCARCHDHKYDPVSQKEFYQIFAYMNNVDEITKEAERRDFNRPIMEVPTPEETIRIAAFRSQFKALSNEMIGYMRGLIEKQKAGGPEPSKDLGLRERMNTLRTVRRAAPRPTTALVMRELPTPRESYIHLGGDFLRKGIPVKPAVPSILPQVPPDATTRLDFAKWLVARNNPLTPRVTVNRIWQVYFGKGIVETEDDFGAVGARPSHPELLDWLASEFMDRGWSQKRIHELIVTSAAYRQASEARPDAADKDPYNKLLARQNRLRLEAEAIRDSALVASGLLTRTVGGPSVYPPIPEGATQVTQVKREWPTEKGPNRYRRAIYTFFQRSAAHPGLLVFDAPDAQVTCTRRNRSNTPLQALTTLNDTSFVEFSQAMAVRILKDAPADDAARLKYGFRLAMARDPRPAETDRLQRYVSTQLDEYRSKPELVAELLGADTKEKDPALLAAWTGVSRVLMNLDGFLTRE